jgi:DNA-binding NtrC family response regulator
MAQKLLLIDENIQLLALTGNYLSKLGYEVHRASEFDEAEALLKNYKYSVVITGTDWEDFGDTGHNLIQCIKSLVHRSRIIFLKETEASFRAAPSPDDEAILVVEKPVSLLLLGDLMHELPIA